MVKGYLARLHARAYRKQLIKERNEASTRIQIYFRYFLWKSALQSRLWSESMLRVYFFRVKVKNIVSDLVELKKGKEMLQKSIDKIMVYYRYMKWRRNFLNLWRIAREKASTRIQIYYRYSRWRKEWYKKWFFAKQYRAYTRIMIYYRYSFFISFGIKIIVL